MKNRQPLTFTKSFLEDSRNALYTKQTLKAMFGDLGSLPAGPILDVGSGSGYFLEELRMALKEPARASIALDTDLAVLADEVRGSPVGATGSALPFRNGCIALAAIHFVLSRMPRAIADHTLAEMARALMPHGQLIAVEPCLGMSTYHSDRDDRLGVLVCLARRMKAERQSAIYDIDENFGLRLPAAIAQHMRVEVTDLHLARWYTPFPSTLGPADREILLRRLTTLRETPGSAAFLKAHGAESDANIPLATGAEITAGHAGHLELTEEGFQYVGNGRAVDIERALDGETGPYEFIPVVRVIARKDS